RGRFAVVITDQKMPQMTGVELLERVGQRLPYLVKVLLSGFTDVPEIERAMDRAGIHNYVVKPIDSEKLRAAVQEAVERHARGRTARRAAPRWRAEVPARALGAGRVREQVGGAAGAGRGAVRRIVGDGAGAGAVRDAVHAMPRRRRPRERPRVGVARAAPARLPRQVLAGGDLGRAPRAHDPVRPRVPGPERGPGGETRSVAPPGARAARAG